MNPTHIASIETGVRALGQSLPPHAVQQLAGLLAELERWNRRINLTAVRDSSQAVALHILDSLAVRPYLQGESAIDIGTGAGFPGLPLAIAEPARSFTLLDSNARKLAFVQHMVGRLGLGNVDVARARAEGYAPEQRFATVIARAVTSLAGLLEISSHLLADEGVLLALKGRYPAEELDELPDDWNFTVTGLDVPGLEDHSRHLVTLRKRRQE